MAATLQHLIGFLLERNLGCRHDQLLKSVYLADLEARRCLGRPFTALSYTVYDGGPFDSDILSELKEMEQLGLLKVEQDGGGQRYFVVGHAAPTSFSKEDRYVLDHVAEAIRAATANGTLDGLVAQSRPMLDAAQRNGLGQRLRMESVDNEAILPGLELEKVLRAVQEQDAGQGRPLGEVMAELRAKAVV